MSKLLKTLALVALFGVILYTTGALADESGGNAFGVATGKLNTLFNNVRSVFYILAAFGLIGMAAAALLGKIQWKWLFALVFGVAIVAGAGYIIDYSLNTTSGVENNLSEDGGE